jgi:polysaccharide biosynthesis/export protein VpsN
MRLLRQDMPRYLCVLFSMALAAMLTACGSNPPPSPSSSSPPSSVQHPPDALQDRQDPLRIGDRVRVELSGIPDMIQPIEQDIKDDGSINLTYVGRVTATGKSPSQLEQEITAKYVPDYYPHISVTVTPVARYFFVGGQVNNNSGGRILYTGGITVMGAIQAAGDFNPFADRKHVQITRMDGTIDHVNCVKAIKNPKLDLPVYPGDRIWVGRRF